MRLRFFRLRNYPPVKDISLNLSAESLLQRECAIRFLVGVNGTGKTHILQALAQTFISLARQNTPHFPVTLIYELGADARRTLIFDNPGTSQGQGWWQSDPGVVMPANYRIEDWHELVRQMRKGEKGWDPLIRAGSAWPGKGVGLPRAVLAYTTGAPESWFDVFRLEPPARDTDIMSQSFEYDISMERPAGWTRNKEIEYQKQLDPRDGQLEFERLEKQEQTWKDEQDQDICLFLTPVMLKFALLAVTLPLAMKDLQKYETEQAVADFIRRIRETPDIETGLRGLLSQVGWVWPVSISFQVDFHPDKWSDSLSRRMGDLFRTATTVIREPDPGTIRRLFFDLKSETRDIYTGNALMDFLGGSDATSFDYFRQLLDLHHEGLIEDVRIAARMTQPGEILLFDELSDGEQMYLGRMALFHLMQGQHDALILLDEPETHFNDKWKREIVDIIDQVLGEYSNHVLISTHSGICLTDVFTPEITLLKKGEDGYIYEKKIHMHTFGATPDHPLRDVFGATGSVGKRAAALLDILLTAEPSKDIVESLWAIPADSENEHYNDLLDQFTEKVRERFGDRYDKARIEQILNSVKGIKGAVSPSEPLTVLKAMDILAEEVGPGYYQFDLYRSIYRLSKDSSEDVT